MGHASSAACQPIIRGEARCRDSFANLSEFRCTCAPDPGLPSTGGGLQMVCKASQHWPEEGSVASGLGQPSLGCGLLCCPGVWEVGLQPS